MHKLAQKIIEEYRKTLDREGVQVHGICESALPYDRDQIKSAIIDMLEQLDEDEIDLKESLATSYIQLGLFMPDEDVMIARKGHAAIISGDIHHPEMEHAEAALKVIARMKLAIEALAKEVRAMNN